MSKLPVLAIRPEPGLSATLAAGHAADLEISGFALFKVEPLTWTSPLRDDFDALLVGSANVFRHGGAGLASFKHLPVLAVGEATGRVARECGFQVARVGKGGLQSLIDDCGDQAAHWLRLAGEDHVPLDIPPQLKLATCITYRVKALEIPQDMARLLNTQCVVLLHSAAAAQHFAKSCEALGIDRARIALAGLGPRVVSEVGKGWKTVEAAATPNDDALLALAKQLCTPI